MQLIYGAPKQTLAKPVYILHKKKYSVGFLYLS